MPFAGVMGLTLSWSRVVVSLACQVSYTLVIKTIKYVIIIVTPLHGGMLINILTAIVNMFRRMLVLLAQRSSLPAAALTADLGTSNVNCIHLFSLII